MLDVPSSSSTRTTSFVFLIVVLGTKCLVKNKRKLQKHTCVSCTHASTFASDLNVQKCYSKRLVEAQNRRG
jgi:hypothetical protein